MPAPVLTRNNHRRNGAVWSSSCSTPAPSPSPSPSTSRSAAAAARPVCFGATPQEWAAQFRAHSIAAPTGIGFVLGALSRNTAFGQYHAASTSGIGALDLATGRMSRITTFAPQVSGLVGMAVEAPWLVWTQLNSKTDQTDWSLHAWNQDTGVTSPLATSTLEDGTRMRGQPPLPVLRRGRVAWSQPIKTAGANVRSQVRVVDLAGGQRWTLASGRVSSPVYAGGYLVWGSVDGGGGYAFQSVDADSLRPATPPGSLPRPDSIGFLGGSADHLAWTSADYHRLTVWRLGSTRSDDFSVQDGRHFFQFLRLAGHFLIWFAGATSSVLDLTTGAGFDVPGGSVTASADWIVRADPVGQAAAKGAPVPARLSRIAIASAPPIARCAPNGNGGRGRGFDRLE